MIFDFLIGKIEKEEVEEEVYKTKFKYKGQVDLNDLYEKLYRWFYENGWVDTQIGKDLYEKYYYERVTREGLRFIEFQFEGKRIFHMKNPKIDFILRLKVVVAPYDPKNKSGTIDFEIRGIRKYEKIKEAKGFGSFLKETWEKNFFKKLDKVSKKELYNWVFMLRDGIVKYLKGYTFKG